MLIYQKDKLEGDICLSKDAAMHVKARRLKIGEKVALCNGEGLVLDAEIVGIDRNQVVCRAKGQVLHERVDYPRLVLGVTKLPTLEFMIQKAVEIGVSEIILLTSEYTPIVFDKTVFDKKRDRWEKIIISACEQSEMYYQPKLSWMTFSDYMGTVTKKCMFHPYGETMKIDKKADLMIGPEGGWSDRELAQGIPLVKLKTGILRADTASIAALLSWQLA